MILYIIELIIIKTSEITLQENKLSMLTKHIASSAVLPSGFRYIPNFVTEAQKKMLLEIVMRNPWCSHLKRQQQYYGIKYFQTKQLDSYLQNKQSQGHLSIEPFNFVIDRIKQELKIKSFIQNQGSPNQVLVNKYLKTDNLGFHVEDINAFGESILGLSLGDEDYLRLAPEDQVGHNKIGQFKVKLQDRSMYVLEGQSRYKWKHGIGRLHEGKIFKEQQFMRISFTFRDVIETRRKL